MIGHIVTNLSTKYEDVGVFHGLLYLTLVEHCLDKPYTSIYQRNVLSQQKWHTIILYLSRKSSTMMVPWCGNTCFEFKPPTHCDWFCYPLEAQYKYKTKVSRRVLEETLWLIELSKHSVCYPSMWRHCLAMNNQITVMKTSWSVTHYLIKCLQ